MATVASVATASAYVLGSICQLSGRQAMCQHRLLRVRTMPS